MTSAGHVFRGLAAFRLLGFDWVRMLTTRTRTSGVNSPTEGVISEQSQSNAIWFFGMKTWWAVAILSPLLMAVLHLWHFCGESKFFFLPATVLVCGYAVFRYWDRTPKLPAGALVTSLMLAAALALISSVTIGVPWLGALALVLIFGSFCISHSDRQSSRLSRFAIPAMFFLPLPLTIDKWMNDVSIKIVGMLAGSALDFADVPNRIVVDACGFCFGVVNLSLFCESFNSANAVAFAAAVICVWNRRPLSLLPVYCLVSIFIASLTSTIQLLIFEAIGESSTLQDAVVIAKGALGGLGLVCSLLLVVSFDRLILFLFYPIEDKSLGRLVYNPIISLWDSAFHLDLDERKRLTRSVTQSVSNKSKHSQTVLVVVSVLMALCVPTQVWHVFHFLSQRQSLPSIVELNAEQVSAILGDSCSINELNRRVSFDAPIFSEASVDWSMDCAGSKLRAALVRVFDEESWIVASKQLGWELSNYDEKTRLSAAPFTVRLLTKDNQQLELFSVTFMPTESTRIISLDATGLLARVKSELKHEKKIQLRIAYEPSSDQDINRDDLCSLLSIIAGKIERAFKFKILEIE